MKSKLAATAIAVALLITPAVALAGAPNGTSTNTVKESASARTTINWQIRLKPTAAYHRATGSAQYQAQPGQREFQVEIERLASLTGKSIAVRVNGATVGWMKVSTTGIAQLTRNSELGQRVPVIVHGSTVTLNTKAGIVIASGTF